MTPSPRPSLRHAVRALRIPAYRTYWLGQFASQTGTWMQSVAQAWLVLHLTDSPLALGTVVTVQFTPVLLFSLVGGVLADRLPKRRLLLLTQSTMLLQAAALAVLTWAGHIQLWQVSLLAALLGTATALDTPTRQAFVRDLVGPEDLPNAVALNSTQFNLARILGPALGGVLIAAVGVAGCFALNALSYLAVLAALWRIRPVPLEEASEPRGSVLAQIGEGLRYAVATPEVALVLLLTGVLGTFGYNFTVVLPLIARYVLNADPVQFGALTTAMGVGALMAALGLAVTGWATRRALLGGAAGFSLLLGLVGLSPWLPLTLALLLALGACSIVFSATANTRLQLATPPALRGRVLSLYTLLFAGSTPIGSLLVGTLAEHGGVLVAVTTLAAACGLGTLAGLAYLQHHPTQPDLASPQPPSFGAAGPTAPGDEGADSRRLRPDSAPPLVGGGR